MKIPIYNQKGEEIDTTELPDEIFGLDFNSDLVHQVAVSQMANQRLVIAHTKDRGDVRGGGRKPWRQKGTGRARHGSRRSPIWIGGGVTFGPTNQRNFKKIIPKKMRRKALFMVLSQKVKDNEMIVLDEIKIEKAKTKEMAKIIQNPKFKILNSKLLIALPKIDKNVILGARNIPKVAIMQAKDLNVLDLLNHKYLMFPKEAINIIEQTFKI